LKLHNILFSADYPAEFDHLFTKKTIFEDPTVYIFISSKAVSSDAPEGKENWYVMINAPESTGQDWDQLRKKAREYITRKIKRMLGIDIEKYIEAEQVNDPVSIETQTSSYHGSLYGNSSNSKFAAFNRHPNYSKKYEGLYFTGGSVHPGGGIPLALSSAKIVSDYILTKHKLKI
jgi:phytoene dehydrogenase-like protein